MHKLKKKIMVEMKKKHQAKEDPEQYKAMMKKTGKEIDENAFKYTKKDFKEIHELKEINSLAERLNEDILRSQQEYTEKGGFHEHF